MWTFRIDAWGDPWATWQHAVEVKVAAGQGPDELANDLENGARLLERVVPPPGPPRGKGAADAARRPRCATRRAASPSASGPALSPEVRQLMHEHPVRELITKGKPHKRLGRPQAGRVRLLVRVLPALHRRARRRRARRCTAPSPPPRPRSTASRRWASTSSTCRRSTRSAAVQPQGPQQHPRRRARTTSARRGPSAPTRAGTTRSTRSSAPSTTSTPSSPAPKSWAWRWRSTSRCSAAPDHPWVLKHPEWFTTRPDGTIAYAENPPKKYQDIYPINFDNDPEGVYEEMLRVVTVLGRPRGARSSGSTTRTPSRRTSGPG